MTSASIALTPGGAARLLYADWWKVYRYHGSRSAWTCLRGSRNLARTATRSTAAGVQFLTFSVVPRLTSLWLASLHRAFGADCPQVTIGDCSGALDRHLAPSPSVTILPLLNQHHGEKLDLLVERACSGQLLVVCDDDIFWLDREPLDWALAQLQHDERLAVVGVVPKAKVSSVLQGKVELPMGSLMVLRRDLWLREGLSFRVRDPEPGDAARWIYDTGEYAQVELGRRGYRVALGGTEQRRHLVAFEAISSWALKVQKRRGRIAPAIANVPLRQEKLLRVVAVARGLAEIVRATCPEVSADLVPAPLLDRAEAIGQRHLGAERDAAIRHEAAEELARVRPALLAADLPARLR